MFQSIQCKASSPTHTRCLYEPEGVNAVTSIEFNRRETPFEAKCPGSTQLTSRTFSMARPNRPFNWHTMHLSRAEQHLPHKVITC